MNNTQKQTLMFCYFYLITTALSYSQITATFDSDLQGWWAVSNPGSAPTPSWQATGGNPGGCYKGKDISIGTWYFLGSTSFKGDLSGYYGCNLTYDVKQDNLFWQFNAEDVIIIKSDDKQLVYDTPYNPGTTWTSYIVPLTYGAGWRLDSLGGTIASYSDIMTFLSDVKRIRIRAEYSGLSYETDYLDNVSISCDAVILPVELTEFTATEQLQNKALLEWKTLTEKNCKSFEIEKSTNGLAFEVIGSIDGNGTTTQTHTYNFVDDAFYNTAYYRLKQIDLNGKITYSQVISLTSDEPSSATAIIYPNPTRDNCWLVLEGFKGFINSYQIIDITGNILFNKVLNMAYTQPIFVDTRNLNAGIYFIKITSPQNIQTINLEITR